MTGRVGFHCPAAPPGNLVQILRLILLLRQGSRRVFKLHVERPGNKYFPRLAALELGFHRFFAAFHVVLVEVAVADFPVGLGAVYQSLAKRGFQEEEIKGSRPRNSAGYKKHGRILSKHNRHIDHIGRILCDLCAYCV